jgi:hypothetical protein
MARPEHGFASKERRLASARLWKNGLAALKRGDSAQYIAIARERIDTSARAIVDRLSQPSSQSASKE